LKKTVIRRRNQTRKASASKRERGALRKRIESAKRERIVITREDLN